MKIKSASSGSQIKNITLVFWLFIVCHFFFPNDLTFFKGIEFLNDGSDVYAAELFPHKESDLSPDPDIHFGVLPNGMRYVLMENSEPKDRVSMHLNIQAGSFSEKDNERGLAHFLEHMMFNGTKNYQSGELVKYFQSIGMRFGPDANAHTGFDETVYDIILPKNDKKSIEDALIVLLDYAENALLLSSEVERERKVILAEKRTRDSASYRNLVSQLSFEFENTLLPKRLPIGTESVLNRAKSIDLKRFYDLWYRPEKTILVIVGAFDIKATQALIKKHFSEFKNRSNKPLPSINIGKTSHAGLKTFYHYEKELGKTDVSISLIRSVPEKNDSKENRKKEILKNIADRLVQNRLNTIIKAGKAPFVKAHIYSTVFQKQFEMAEISAECSAENWEKTLEQIEKILRRTIEFGFHDIELERVKSDYLAEIENDEKQASTRDSTRVARTIIYHLNNNRVFQSPGQKRVLYGKIINEASLKDVHNAFLDTWSKEHRLIEVTGDAPIGSKTQIAEEKIAEVFKGSEKIAVAKPPAPPKIQFPYLSKPKNKGRVKQKKNFEDLGITQITFKNGVSLNLKKTDFNKNEVMLSLVIGKGRSVEPKSLSGLSELTQMVVNESGVGDLSKDDIEKALSGKNIRYSFYAGEDNFIYSIRCATSEIALSLHILYAYLSDFKLSPDAFKVSMDRLKQSYQKKTTTPDGVMEIEGDRFLAGGDSRFGLVSHEVFGNYTLKDIEKWYLPILEKEPIEINVVGDFEKENEIVSFITHFFGTLKKRSQKKTGRVSSPEFPNSKIKKINVPTETQKALVAVCYPTDDYWNIKRTRRLNVLADIFTDKLRLSIRENFGFSYSQYAYNDPSRAFEKYGVFHTVTYVDPEKSEPVIAEMKSIAENLFKGNITEDDLKRAVNPTLSEIKKIKRKNSYWLYNVLSGLTDHPEKIEWARTVESDYRSISLGEMKTFAKTYLVNQKAATLVIGPQ